MSKQEMLWVFNPMVGRVTLTPAEFTREFAGIEIWYVPLLKQSRELGRSIFYSQREALSYAYDELGRELNRLQALWGSITQQAKEFEESERDGRAGEDVVVFENGSRIEGIPRRSGLVLLRPPGPLPPVPGGPAESA